jgi:hypothetical protein
VSQDADAGPAHNDNPYYISMIRVGVGFVSNKTWNASSDNIKRCWTGLNRNTDYYLEIHKTIAVPGQLLAGQGVVSYT